MDETPKEWLEHLFEFNYCDECGGDAEDHDICFVPGFGNYFARCKPAGEGTTATGYGVEPDGIREPAPPQVVG